MKISPAGVKILTVCYIVILAGIIFIAGTKSTRSVLNFVGNIPYGDKLGHFFLMGFLSFLVNLVFSARNVGFGKIRYLLGSLIVLVVVTIEEFSQLFIRGRTFSVSDLIADFLGIFIFGELARLAYHKFLSNQKT
jgi:polysaccharide biosynthesis protein VpsQ